MKTKRVIQFTPKELQDATEEAVGKFNRMAIKKPSKKAKKTHLRVVKK
jgi:hypothetical protein